VLRSILEIAARSVHELQVEPLVPRLRGNSSSFRLDARNERLLLFHGATALPVFWTPASVQVVGESEAASGVLPAINEAL